jgi:hypothetical protein
MGTETKMSDARELTGACLCGSVRYTAAPPILAARQCWCRVCQYLACGSGATNIIVAREGLRVEGAVAEYRSVADSGNHMVRSFCPACGTHLFSASEERAHLVVIRVGTLDDPELGAPRDVIWTASAPSWACIDEALTAHAGQPAPPVVK